MTLATNEPNNINVSEARQLAELAAAGISAWGFPLQRKKPEPLVPQRLRIIGEKEQASLVEFGASLPENLYNVWLNICPRPSSDDSNQLAVWQFDDEDNSPGAQLFRARLLHPTIPPVMLFRLMLCGKLWIRPECPDGHFAAEEAFPVLCHSRFCPCEACARQRKLQILSRLNFLGIKSHRLFHMSLGSNRLTKKQLYAAVALWSKEMRLLGYKLRNIRVFDTSRDGFLHVHIVFIPEKNLAVHKSEKFLSDCWRVVRSKRSSANIRKLVPAVFGWKYKQHVFDYLAKRGAGILGHDSEGFSKHIRTFDDDFYFYSATAHPRPRDDDYFFYSDIMSIEDFARDFYKKRFVVVDGWKKPSKKEEPCFEVDDPEGLVNNACLQAPRQFCPVCKKKLVPRLVSGYISITKPPPPPCSLCGGRLPLANYDNFQRKVCVVCADGGHACQACVHHGGAARKWCSRAGVWQLC